MKITLRPLLITILFCLFIILVAAIVKLNVLDVPYDGKPITYVASNGEALTTHHKVDGSVEVNSQDDRVIHLNPITNASGARYSNSNQTLELWVKRNEAMLLENGQIGFTGLQESSGNNKLADSIWLYRPDQESSTSGTVTANSQLTLNLGQEHFFGEAKCHSFFGNYQYQNAAPTLIRFINITVHERPCNSAVAEQEQQLLATLKQVKSVHYQEEKLQLYGPENQQLHFKLFGLQTH